MDCRSLTAATGFFVTLAVVSSPALAQDLPDVEKPREDLIAVAREPGKPAWESSLGASFLPGSAVGGTGGDVTMEEFKAELSKRFTVNTRLALSAGVHYSLRDIDAPASANLPGALHAVSLNLGGEYRANDKLTFGARIAPGLSGDLKSVDANDLKVPVALHARYRLSERFTVQGGLVYSGGSHGLRVLPAVGFLYLPADRWAVSVGFPRTGVTYKPNHGTELFVAGEFTRVEYHVGDPSVAAKFVSYRDYRIAAGAEFSLLPSLKVALTAGYAFGRRFLFYDSYRNDLRLDSAPYGNVVIKLAFR